MLSEHCIQHTSFQQYFHQCDNSISCAHFKWRVKVPKQRFWTWSYNDVKWEGCSFHLNTFYFFRQLLFKDAENAFTFCATSPGSNKPRPALSSFVNNDVRVFCLLRHKSIIIRRCFLRFSKNSVTNRAWMTKVRIKYWNV